MDHLSVSTSITGLLTASLEVAKLFASLITTYDYARTVHDEIHHLRFVIFRLDKYVSSNSINVARASMIDLDQIVTVLLGCMYTFSELEREVKRLQSKPDVLRRMWWTAVKSNMVDLVQRLQMHKGVIVLMLMILTRYG
ncbi:hypothetical protein P167DRAFT_83544 [Morchella conica CCBAS932]|uniref:Fungal N-terminal domain-containing protein n=1 Tax=Morchella conica CCBAS932 TaxID=1392247 RepID=A0A3N4K7U7_9PEZI|nr:hypothetical protein P167DRAFT_83544 [Morchella conica CCBAS932]